MNDPTLLLPGLSPVSGKSVVARFDGGMLSSDAGVLALREVEARLSVAQRLAGCIADPRCPDRIVHDLADMIGFRQMMVEAGDQGTDTRFIVSNLSGKARALYQNVYCRRGAVENHIKSWKTHLAADRTSCTRATANQFRLFLHAGAYWLLWGLRAMMPKPSSWRVAQFDTLRLRLIKVAARVVELKTQIRLHLPTACPEQKILQVVLVRIPRLVT